MSARTSRRRRCPLALGAAALFAVATTAVAAQQGAPAGEPADPRASAAVPDRGNSGARAEPDHRSRSAERLLRLEDGRVLRGKTRLRDGTWQWRQQGEWQALPAELVVSHRDEREAEREWARRRKAVGRHDAAARVEVCRWALAEGLLTEALNDLDRMLADDPDEPHVRALLARDDLPPLAPRWEPFAHDLDLQRERLLAFGGASGATLQQLVLLELERASGLERDALRADLTGDLGHAEDGRRLFATRALRQLFPDAATGEAREQLEFRALADRAEDVRAGARAALVAGGAPEAHEPFVEALSHEHPRVRLHAAEALGALGHLQAVPPLMELLVALRPAPSGGRPSGTFFAGRQVSYVAGYDAEIAQGAAAVAPRIGVIQEGATLSAKVQGVSGGSVIFTEETRAVRSALKRLTGARVSDTNRAWKRWWSRHGEAWVAQHLGGQPSAAQDDARG